MLYFNGEFFLIPPYNVTITNLVDSMQASQYIYIYIYRHTHLLIHANQVPCYVLQSYDATTHFESTVMDVLNMYTMITGKVKTGSF